ncbi:MAG: hypothetical protein AAGI88_25165 [Pseudomonadota bacterium]
MQNQDGSRLLLELEKLRRDINREIMNPAIDEVSIEDFRPIITIVARARLRYLEQLFAISKAAPDLPSRDKIAELEQRREAYDELCSAANALETAVERGYLDVRYK